jgi:hypothetical protein
MGTFKVSVGFRVSFECLYATRCILSTWQAPSPLLLGHLPSASALGRREGEGEREGRGRARERECVCGSLSWEFVRSGLTRDCNACLAGTYVHKKEEDTCHMRRRIHVI